MTGPDGKPVTDYEVEHDKKLHLIVGLAATSPASSTCTPSEAADGTWSVPLTCRAGTVPALRRLHTRPAAKGLTLGRGPARRRATTPRRCPGDPHRHGRRTTPSPWPEPDARASTPELTSEGRQGRQAGHRPAALPGRLRPPGGAARQATWPTSTSTRTVTPGDGRTQPGPEVIFYAEVPSGRRLPALPRLPARRGGPHRRLHRSPPAGSGTGTRRADGTPRRPRARRPQPRSGQPTTAAEQRAQLTEGAR